MLVGTLLYAVTERGWLAGLVTGAGVGVVMTVGLTTTDFFVRRRQNRSR